jgi:hypothetical protein
LKRSRDVVDRRIQEMAREVDADGVVGVHVSRQVEEFELEDERDRAASSRSHHLLTLSLIGTAVRYEPREEATAVQTRPVVSLRSGQLEPTWTVSVPEAVTESLSDS